MPTISYRGSVELVDEFGQPVTDRSGVTVSVVDRPGVAATTDGAGSFSLQVPQGSQRLSLTKVGYGTYLTPALTVADAPLVASQPITLGQITSTYVTFIRGWEPMNYGEYFRFTGRINLASTPPTQVRYHRLFFATSPQVSPTNYKGTILFSGSFPDPNTPSNPTWHWVGDSISRPFINSLNLGPYDKIYCVVYGDNPAAETYADPVSGLTVYPAISKQASELLECNR